MPTKPSDNVPEFAANANFSVGQTGIIGTPTRETIGLSTAVANGAVPWLAESPLTGQHYNEWMHRGWGLLDWVYQGTSGPAADAHIVETDSAGRTEWTAAPGGAGVATIEATVTGSGGTAIQGSAVNGVSIRASNDSATLAALVATNADATAGAASCLASAIGAGDGFRADVFDSARGFVATFDSSAATNCTGFFASLGTVEANAMVIETGSNSGIGMFVDVQDGSFAGISCYASSGSQRLIRLQHDDAGIALEVATSGTAAGAVINGSSSANVTGTVQITGNGAVSPGLFVASTIDSVSDAEARARAAIRAEATVGTGARAVGIYGSADGSPSGFSAGVYGATTGTSQDCAGVYADATVGGSDGHGLIALSSSQRSQIRLQPLTAAPLNGRVGDFAAIDPASALNEGLLTYVSSGWQRIAHTAYRYREPAVGFSNASNIVGVSTSSPLAEALFTAADGGDVIVRVSFGFSRSAVGVFQVSVCSDNGVGGAVTTHLSLRDVRVLTSTAASTMVAGTWSWIRKITPTNTGERRYYIELTEPSAATTLYYWDVGLSVEGEVTP